MSEISQVDASIAPSGTGCVECTSAGGWWFHLRRCAACGHIGCCDSSPSQHARAHWGASGHRYMQSFEPSEDWYWDFEASTLVDGPPLADPTSHPADQPVPGPDGLVPEDWVSHLH